MFSYILLSLVAGSVAADSYTLKGCYALSDLESVLTSKGTYQYQTNSYCEQQCGSAVAATLNGSGCYCGDSLPSNIASVSSDKCDTTCYGYGTEICGGDGYLSVYTNGEEDDDADSSSSSKSTSSTKTSSTTTLSSTKTSSKASTTTSSSTNSEETTTTTSNSVTQSVTVVTSVISASNVVQVITTTASSASGSDSSTTSASSSGGLSKGAIAGIAIGSIFGVASLVAVLILIFIKTRNSDQDDDDEDTVSASQEKFPTPPIHNDFNYYGFQQPVPPLMETGHKRLSNGSLPDARHEKTLRIVNPDDDAVNNDTTLQNSDHDGVSFSDTDSDDWDFTRRR